MLAFEDLHWGDPSLLDLVEMLGARLHDVPVLVLVLARPELLDTRPAWGGGLPSYTALPLQPLSEAEARELAGSLLEELTIGDREQRAALFAATAEGNPLFIEQLAAASQESSAQPGALPTTIRGIVAARLDALPAAERAVLVDAAVEGKVFWEGLLLRTTDVDELPALLANLERRDLVRRDRVSAIEGDHQYAFKHVLIRDVAYELLPRARRRELHEQCARFLEQATSEVGEAGAALGRHWRDAGNPAARSTTSSPPRSRRSAGGRRSTPQSCTGRRLGWSPKRMRTCGCRSSAGLRSPHQAAFHVDDARALGLGGEND